MKAASLLAPGFRELAAAGRRFSEHLLFNSHNFTPQQCAFCIRLAKAYLAGSVEASDVIATIPLRT